MFDAVEKRGCEASVRSAMRAGREFLDSHGVDELLARVGQCVPEIAVTDSPDKQVLPASYGGGAGEHGKDFLVGRGLFYFTEEGRLFLDCTAGHYQMLWGYNHPDLCHAVERGQEAGIVWDNHSNIPQWPIKALARQLLTAVNPTDSPTGIDKALMGVCTGSSADAAALKMQLVTYQQERADAGDPVMIVLEGNYHGTDMFTQYLRGMWQQYVTHLDVVSVEPNDDAQLREVFARFGKRVAGFWAEPVMMNREAIRVRPEYLQLARQCCNEVGAALCIDEIQTGFWQPEVLMSAPLGCDPDMVVVGKGMTAGFHPLSALLFKSSYDRLAQYDALNTNGGASLAGYVALCSLEMLDRAKPRIVAIGDRIMAGMVALAKEFPEVLVEARGYRHLAGLKFHRVEDALDFHKQAVAAGLWVRAHAYHAGHSTILTKLGLLADEKVVDFMIAQFRELLKNQR